MGVNFIFLMHASSQKKSNWGSASNNFQSCKEETLRVRNLQKKILSSQVPTYCIAIKNKIGQYRDLKKFAIHTNHS